MKAAKVYITTFIVEGRGQFPTDMLRYDTCVPNTSADATAIDNAGYQEPRTVELRRYSSVNGPPTIARWNSFYWKVLSVKDTTGRRLA